MLLLLIGVTLLVYNRPNHFGKFFYERVKMALIKLKETFSTKSEPGLELQTLMIWKY